MKIDLWFSKILLPSPETKELLETIPLTRDSIAKMFSKKK